MSNSIALRLRFPKILVDDPTACAAVGEILTRPCFAALESIAAKQGDKHVKRTRVATDVIASYLGDHDFEGIVLENRGGDITASGEIPNGEHARSWSESPVRYYAYAALPFIAADTRAVVQAACDLAAAVDARSGGVTVEPDYQLAQRWGLEMKPRPRPGLSERRMRERRAHRHFEDQLGTKVGGPEWGFFLGTGHLHRIDRTALSRAATVIELTPSLVYVQTSNDPLDNLTDTYDSTLDRLREVLGPVLMDTSMVDQQA